MPVCSSCNTLVKGNDARFCSTCGNPLELVLTSELLIRPEMFEEICGSIIRLLDQARNRWFELVKEGICEDFPDGSLIVVNGDFNERHSIPMSEEEMPNGFPFNTMTGQTVEAALMDWQSRYVHYFATQKHDYLKNVDKDRFWNAFSDIVIKSGPCWVLSVAGIASNIDDSCIVEVLGHYTTGESTRSAKWVAVCKSIKTSLPLFHLMTYMATASAFGDQKTVQEIQEQMGY